jgi:hypothetical protein
MKFDLTPFTAAPETWQAELLFRYDRPYQMCDTRFYLFETEDQALAFAKVCEYLIKHLYSVEEDIGWDDDHLDMYTDAIATATMLQHEDVWQIFQNYDMRPAIGDYDDSYPMSRLLRLKMHHFDEHGHHQAVYIDGQTEIVGNFCPPEISSFQ